MWLSEFSYEKWWISRFHWNFLTFTGLNEIQTVGTEYINPNGEKNFVPFEFLLVGPSLYLAHSINRTVNKKDVLANRILFGATPYEIHRL